MRRYLRKTFLLILITLASVSIFIGMIAGPFGYTEISIGFSVAGIIFSCVIIGFSLVNWTKSRKRKM
ncbi:MAG: hypothetical protein R3Y33_06525 [Clostridia bacterium]